MIFKPSMHKPSLSEIDITENNTFSCTVNSSGEPALAYKMSILTEDGDTVVEGETTNLLIPMPNKSQINIKNVNNTGIYSDLVNGKAYQWGMRIYNAKKGSTAQPNTKVCDGYMTGSTKYVIWVKIPNQDTTNKNIVDQITENRYVEFYSTSLDDLIIGNHEPDDKKLPDQTPFVERKKIDWVTKELGIAKNFIKIETSENFDYDYRHNKTFSIYRCASDHTVTSAFADPNTNINVADRIMIYNNATEALNAFNAGEDPSTDTANMIAKESSRTIVGYSSDTGEIRVHDDWSVAPSNGNVYRIFEQDVSTKLYNEIFSSEIKFTIPAGTVLYPDRAPAGISYYDSPTSSTPVGQLTVSYPSYVYSNTKSRIYRAGTPYYVNNSDLSGSSFTTTGAHGVTVHDDKCGVIYIDGSDATDPDIAHAGSWNCLFNNVEQKSTMYNSQVIGGIPIENNSLFKVFTNNWVIPITGLASNDRVILTDGTYIQAEQYYIYKLNTTYYYYDPSAAGGSRVKQYSSTAVANMDLTSHIFIQPNINIKPDYYNPDEIVFINDSRVDIVEQYYYMKDGEIVPGEGQSHTMPAGAKKVDATFNKLDNTQWLLENCDYNQSPYQLTSIGIPPIIPQSDYTVYTDFADSAPYNIFYTRITPFMKIQYRNAGEELVEGFAEDIGGVIHFYDPDGDEIQNPSSIYLYHDANTDIYYRYINDQYTQANDVWEELDDIPRTFRMVEFRTLWQPPNNGDRITQIKSYQYTLYGYDKDSTVPQFIKQSEVIYSTDAKWIFRGLDGTKSEYYSHDYPHHYTITIQIFDEYDKEYNIYGDFYIFYETDESPLSIVVAPDCDTQSIYVEVNSPVLAQSLDDDVWGLDTVTNDDLIAGRGVNIPEGKTLNYAALAADEHELLEFPSELAFYTEFELTEEFINKIAPITTSNLDPTIDVFELQHNTGNITNHIYPGTTYYKKTLPAGTPYYNTSELGPQIVGETTEPTDCTFITTSYSYIVITVGALTHTYYVATQVAGTVSSEITEGIDIKTTRYSEVTISDVVYYVETEDVDVIEDTEKFTAKLHSFAPYYLDDQGKINANNNLHHLTIHKNDGPALTCFNISGTESNWINILSPNSLSPDFYINYALQATSDLNRQFDYVVVNDLPLTAGANPNIRYILPNDTVNYSKGIYKIETDEFGTRYWTKANDRDFVFASNTSDVPGSTYGSLSVPANSRLDSGTTGDIGYADSGNIWVDNTSDAEWQEAIAKNKFCFYIRIYYENGQQIVDAQELVQRI